MELTEDDLISRLKQREEAAFEEVFKANYKSLHAYAFTILREAAAAEEIVQNVFYKLWERTDSLSIEGSLRAYLYRAVHNESLNHVKHLKVRKQHQLHIVRGMDQSTENASRKIQTKELEKKIQDALNDLPEQCRTVFQLSRFEELRYREIADRLNISVKTVENQMGKALKLMRLKLVEFLPLIFLFTQLNTNA